MTTVILYEDAEGKLFLRLRGDRTLWCMNERTASTFLTDALLVANEDTASHPSIFFSHIPWEGNATEDLENVRCGEATLHAIATLTLDPSMEEYGAAYTLYFPRRP